MPGDPTPTLKPPVGDADHVRGPADAAVVLVEYGDYQCAHCGKAAAVVDAICREFDGRLRFAYRHFPLGKIHPMARKAAEAAEAAAAQGKFWEMHASLLVHAASIDGPGLSRLAADVGLDVARFDAELATGAYAERVQADVAGGARGGVNGTPTFFLDGVRHPGGFARDALRNAVAALFDPIG